MFMDPIVPFGTMGSIGMWTGPADSLALFSFKGGRMGVAAVFIDGGYLDKVLRYDHANRRIDYEGLVRAMVGENDLLRAYYYHCLPYQSNPPTGDERNRYAAKHRFVTALRHIPRFEVRLGKLAYRGTDRDGQPIFQQKRVDLMLGVDMALLAAKGRIAEIALFSGDSDCIPAIEVVKSEGVLTTLWHGSRSPQTRPSRELVEACDERRELTGDVVASILRS